MESAYQIAMLIADDNPDILKYFQAILKGAQNKLYFAINGIEALEKAKNYKIDLAFIDVNMPKMNGLETLVNWKKTQPNTQIIMISSYSDGHLVRQAIAEGAYTYLFKPLNKRDIFSVIAKSLKELGINEVISFS